MSQPQTIQFSLPSDPNVSYIDTVHAYDQWANIYDGDGNFLQALDTIEMRSLLPEFLSLVKTTVQSRQKGEDTTTAKLIDLGCGTGRNTIQLLEKISSQTDDSIPFQNAQIIGLDASNGMLDVAREAVATFSAAAKSKPNVTLFQFDLLGDDDTATTSTTKADGMISTLVLEHVPLDTYFSKAANLLHQGAYFLVSNMHADMGKLGQAGFVDPATKKKVRPMRSYAHEIGDVLGEAERAGFEVVPLRGTSNSDSPGVEGVVEKAVTEDILGALGQRASKYLGVTVWFGVCFRKK
ncbi:putative methyltransferase AN0656 [Talaromyces islandicus]|uniref:Putative methyltransferase AN0656 n=1 Tax=Talaromyces islandicus TaxID=28573 RepID=A0A0U1M269_TALIS|nr:putative methyltransferase AN0656 [Talaromyces islandicus]